MINSNLKVKVKNQLSNRSFEEFINTVQNWHENHLCCNYYQLRINYSNCKCMIFHDKDFSKELLTIIETSINQPKDYFQSLAKGYINLINAKLQTEYNHLYYEKAFKYLTISIDLNQNQDFPYYLRSFINDTFHSSSIINKYFENDALKAVSLNPSAKNLFQLASLINTDAYILNDRKLQTSLNYLAEAIKLQPNFLCALESISLINVKLKKYKKAIKYYNRIIAFDANKDVYLNLSECYSFLKKNKKALKFAKEALEKNSHRKYKWSYYRRLADIFLNIGDYDSAEVYLMKYHNKGKNDFKVKKEIINSKLEKAEKHYHEDELLKSKSIYEEIIDNNWSLEFKELNLYLKIILRIKNPENIIIENHPLYKKFDEIITKKISTDDFASIVQLSFDNDKLKNLKKLHTYYWDDEFNFGKYKGKTVYEILEINPNYILWCIINLDHFSVYNGILTFPTYRNNEMLEIAITHNLIKQALIKKHNLEKPEWTQNDAQSDDYDYRYYNDSSYYNDSLDLDQQSPEFWDDI